MKILLAGIIGFVVVASALFYVASLSNSVSYTQTLETEITELETELAAIEASVQAGTLTPEKAAQAYTDLTQRFTSIQRATQNTSIWSRLSEEERAAVRESALKLQELLVWYSGTLDAIDNQVASLPAETERRLRTGGSSSLRSVALDTTAALVETIDTITTEVTELTDEFVSEFTPDTANGTTTEQSGADETTVDADANIDAEAAGETGNNEAELDSSSQADSEEITTADDTTTVSDTEATNSTSGN